MAILSEQPRCRLPGSCFAPALVLSRAGFEVSVKPRGSGTTSSSAVSLWRDLDSRRRGRSPAICFPDPMYRRRSCRRRLYSDTRRAPSTVNGNPATTEKCLPYSRGEKDFDIRRGPGFRLRQQEEVCILYRIGRAVQEQPRALRSLRHRRLRGRPESVGEPKRISILNPAKRANEAPPIPATRVVFLVKLTWTGLHRSNLPQPRICHLAKLSKLVPQR